MLRVEMTPARGTRPVGAPVMCLLLACRGQLNEIATFCSRLYTLLLEKFSKGRNTYTIRGRRQSDGGAATCIQHKYEKMVPMLGYSQVSTEYAYSDTFSQ